MWAASTGLLLTWAAWLSRAAVAAGQPYSTGGAAAMRHLAAARAGPQATGQVDRALPVPARSTSASSASMCTADSAPAGAPAADGEQPPDPRPDRPRQGGQRRGVGSGTGAQALRRACGREPRRGGRRPRAAGRPMRARAARDARARGRARASPSSAPGTDPAEGRVVVVRVVPRVEALGRAGRARRDPREARRGRAKRSRRRGIPARDRAPEPRARPSRTCSAWSSRVWPSSTSSAPSARAAASRAA